MGKKFIRADGASLPGGLVPVAALGLALGILIKLFVLDILHVSGVSMEPAISDGETVLVDKLAYGMNRPFSGEFYFRWRAPERGDVVVFLHDDKIVVKRVVLVQGDRMEFLSDSGYSLVIDGRRLPVSASVYGRLGGASEVPDGYVFVLGDNLMRSVDSRDYGFVSADNITGKVIGK